MQLEIAQLGQPVLREVAAPVPPERIARQPLQELVADMIRQDSLGLDVDQDSKTITTDLMGRYGVSASGIMEMLANEYRVRIARRPPCWALRPC